MTRIISGAAKGRRLAVPPSGTRPTSDRAREGLFNSLVATVDLDGARVLDLYAGSGAVGLEALSRGAASAVLVESNRRAVEVLRRNAATVGLPGVQVVASPVNRYLSDTEAEFDLIFADPPYAEADKQLTAVATLADTMLSRDGTMVFEAPATLRPIELSWITWAHEKRYGETRFWYGRRR